MTYLLPLLLTSLLLLADRDANATPTIHKCVDANGIATYQHEVCQTHYRHAWTREVEAGDATAPSAAGRLQASGAPSGRGKSAARRSRKSGALASADVGTPATFASSYIDADRQRARHYQRIKPRNPRGRPPNASAQAALIPLNPKAATPACQSALRRREETLARVGFKRTYAQLQKLDDSVHRACQ